MTTYTRTLDGVTDFTDIWGNTLTWGSSKWIPWYDTNEPTSSGTLTANYNLTGSDWTIVAMQVWAEDGNKITLTDLDAGTGREINYLRLGFDSDVDLISTRVQHIEGWEGGLHDIVLGSEYTDTVNLYADVNKLTIGTGGAGRVNTGGRDTIIIGSGGAQSVETGGRNDKVTVRNGGGVQSIDVGNGNDKVVLNAAYADQVELGNGNDVLTLRNGSDVNTSLGSTGDNVITVKGDSRINMLEMGDGDVVVDVQDTSRIYYMKFYDGSGTVTTADGNIESVFSYQALMDVTIGAGGVQQMVFGGTVAGRHSVVVDGWLGSLRVDDNGVDLVTKGSVGSMLLGEQRDTVKTGGGRVELISTSGGNDTVKIGAGGAETVRTGDGNDVVKTTSGHVELIKTGDGNDKVTLGSKVVGRLMLGDGDDHVAVAEIGPDDGNIIWGGNGTDTIDFTAYTTGVTVDLTFNGWQDPRGNGWLQVMWIENLIGTNKADKIAGDDAANTLRGLGGNDKFSGGGGNDRLIGDTGADVLKGGGGADTLIGGRGNDKLTGGGGGDVFVFAAKAGTDTVTDFQDGTDLLRIGGHSGGFAALVFDDVSGDLEITHDGGIILLEGLGGATLGADDFDFV